MGTYEVSVEHSFRAWHAIAMPDGSWENSHEHLWATTAVFRSRELDPARGVVIDFLDVMRAMTDVATRLEGRDLNKIEPLSAGGAGASAERVAEYLARLLREAMGKDGDKLYCVSVTEAPGCRAAYFLGP